MENVICHVNTRKCRSVTENFEAGHSKWRSRNRTDETAFSYCSREDKGFVPIVFVCTLGAILVLVCLLSDSIIYLDSIFVYF